VKFGGAVSYTGIYKQKDIQRCTDKQTDRHIYRHTDMLIAILSTFPGDKVVILNKNSSGDEIANVLVNDDIAHT